MDYETMSEIPTPKKIEPCWRCGAEPVPTTVQHRERSPMTLKPTGDPVILHLYICSHCGYSVPGPADELGGYPQRAVAALRWNGEMISNRERTAKEARLGGIPLTPRHSGERPFIVVKDGSRGISAEQREALDGILDSIREIFKKPADE